MELKSHQIVTTGVLLLAVFVTSRTWTAEQGDSPHMQSRRALLASISLSDNPKQEHGSQEMLRTVEMEPFVQHYFRCGLRAGGLVSTDDTGVYYWVYEISGNEVVNRSLGRPDAFDGKMYASPAYYDQEGFSLPARSGLQRFKPNTWYYYFGSSPAMVSCSNGIRIEEA